MQYFIRFVVSAIFGFLFIGIALDFSRNDIIIFATGVIAFGVTWFFVKSWQTKSRIEMPQIKSVVEKPKTAKSWGETEGRPYRFIFTHNEDALDAIESIVRSHPKVTDVYQDTGNWYSNGETGPEWFSMHVRCKETDSEEVQQFITAELQERNYDTAGIRFMGDYN